MLVRVQHSTSLSAPESLPPECFDGVCFPSTGAAGVGAVDVLVAPFEAADAYENVPAERICSFAPLAAPNEAGGKESIARASKERSTAEGVEVEVVVLVEGFESIFFVLLPIQESVLQLEM